MCSALGDDERARFRRIQDESEDPELFVKQQVYRDEHPDDYDGFVAGKSAREAASKFLFDDDWNKRMGSRRFVVGRQKRVYYGNPVSLVAKTRRFSDMLELFDGTGEKAVTGADGIERRDIEIMPDFDMADEPTLECLDASQKSSFVQAFDLVWIMINGAENEPFWNPEIPLDVLIRMWIPWTYFGVIQYLTIEVWMGVVSDRFQQEIRAWCDVPESMREMLKRFSPLEPVDREFFLGAASTCIDHIETLYASSLSEAGIVVST